MSYIVDSDDKTIIITECPYKRVTIKAVVSKSGVNTESYPDLTQEQLASAQKGDPVETEVLQDVLPQEFFSEFMETKAAKFLYVPVTESYGWGEERGSLPWVGNHKNVHNWWKLQNGYAVGWNENPSVGWGFPVQKV